MLDLFPAELRQPVWYIMAGFILGFAVSTLWEWLYFRRFRIETEADDTGRFVAGTSEISNSTPTPVLQQSPEFEPASVPGAYRSPTVFLNRERMQNTSPTISTKTESTAFSERIKPAPLAQTQIVENASPPHEADIDDFAAEIENESASTGSEDVAMPKVEFSTTLDTSDAKIQSAKDEQSANDVRDSKNTSQTQLGVPSAELVVRRDPWITPSEGTAIGEPIRTGSRVPRSRGYPDDLTKIRGIGEVYKRRLYAAHIFTFHHIATSDVEVLRRATQAAPNANVDSWSAQAEELAQKYQRGNASYSGPLPDDLQQIPGIGPYFAQTLYRSGICTFEQLADSSLDELRTIFPPSVLGREVDLQQWLDVAQEEAQKRQ